MGTIDKNLADVTQALMSGGAQAPKPDEAAIQAAIIEEPTKLVRTRPKPTVVPARAARTVVEEVEPEEEYPEELKDEDVEAEDLEEDEEVEAEDVDAENEPESDELFDVVIDGKDYQVSFDDLVSGYSGKRHVQQGMEQVTTQRKQIEAAAVSYKQKVTWLDQQAQQLETMLGTTQEPNIDWDKLHKENPTEWMHQREMQRERNEIRAGQLAAVQKIRDAKQDEDRVHSEYSLQGEKVKVQSAIPDFYDPEKGLQIKTAMYKTAATFGMDKALVDSITDSRQIRALHKLSQYMAVDDELKIGKRKGKKKALKGRIRSGNKQNSTPSMRAAKLQAQKVAKAKQTGKPDDVALTLFN